MILHGRRFCSAGLLAMLSLCWVAAIAQTSAPASNLGTISGRVVNESGRPLANARIILKSSGLMLSTENNSTNTDREGKFEVSGLKPMSYQVSADLQGYVPVLRNDPHDAQAGIYHVGDVVSLVMTKGGVITGAVTDQAGEPVVGVRVEATIVRSANRLPSAEHLVDQSDMTDDRGIYRIYGLLEGTYVVWAGGNGPRPDDLDPFANDVRTYAPASARDTAQEIVVRGGAETNGVDITYRGGSGLVVSGKVSGPAGEQNLGFVILLVSSGGVDMRSFQRPNDRGFMLSGVDDCDYEIIAMSGDRPDSDWMLSAVKQIKVRGADVTGVELVVRPLSSIIGRVVLEESVPTACNDKRRPIFTETLISAQSNSTDTLPPAFGVLRAPVNADERGNVTFKNLSPGRYYFTTQHFADDWYLKSIAFVPSETAKAVDAARTWTTLKSGDRLRGLTITLAPGAATLRAQIALSKGETLAEKLNVYLVPVEKEAIEDPLRFYGAVVTAQGKVVLHNLAPGRYRVFAQRATEESSLLTLRSPAGTAFRAGLLRDAEAVQPEIELKACQKVAELKVPVRTK
jgi:hypothetical protein